MATRQSRGRRARFTLRTIIRGWPYYYETTPVFPNEVLLRTVPNILHYCSQNMGNWIINPNAFTPAPDDVDGIARAIEELLKQWREGSVHVGSQFTSVAAEFDIRRVAAQFSGLLTRAFDVVRAESA